MPRTHDPSKARRHWTYTRADLCNLFDVCDTTITNWIKDGLAPVDESRPQIFTGFGVRGYLTKKRWRGQRDPKDGKLYCNVCFLFVPLNSGTIIVRRDELRRNHINGHCTACDTPLSAYVTKSQLGELRLTASNYARDSSAAIGDLVSGDVSGRVRYVAPETYSLNLRWLYRFQVFLLHNKGLGQKTVDEYLRSLARMSAIHNQKAFSAYAIEDALKIKRKLKGELEEDESDLSLATVARALEHCEVFFNWLTRQEDIDLPIDLSGYFRLPLQDRKLAGQAAKGTDLTFDQAVAIFRLMPSGNPIEFRDRAIVALLIMTGIRVEALTTLRGKHVNTETWWIFQTPPEVRTKNGKAIRSYCLDLRNGSREAVLSWQNWRKKAGFDDDDAFFLPDKFIEPNKIGLGYCVAGNVRAEAWRSTDPVRRIVKAAAEAAGYANLLVGAHDFRKTIHPYLSSKGEMSVRHEVALQLNLGHTPGETIRKHYSDMLDADRKEFLNELCRMAVGKSDMNLVLAFERGQLAKSDPDFDRAKRLHASCDR